MSRIFFPSDAVFKPTGDINYSLENTQHRKRINSDTNCDTYMPLCRADHAPALKYIFRTSLKELSNMLFALHGSIEPHEKKGAPLHIFLLL
jgi:hypothetical protein